MTFKAILPVLIIVFGLYAEPSSMRFGAGLTYSNHILFSSSSNSSIPKTASNLLDIIGLGLSYDYFIPSKSSFNLILSFDAELIKPAIILISNTNKSISSQWWPFIGINFKYHKINNELCLGFVDFFQYHFADVTGSLMDERGFYNESGFSYKYQMVYQYNSSYSFGIFFKQGQMFRKDVVFFNDVFHSRKQITSVGIKFMKSFYH